MTIAVDDFCTSLVESWPELPDHVKRYVRTVVEDAYRRNQLGHDCDKRSWGRVRALWSEKVRLEVEISVREVTDG